MRYELILAPWAVQALGALRAHERAEVRDALEQHLRYERTRVSKSRIKRLRGLSHPSIVSGSERSECSMTSRPKSSKSSPSSRRPRQPPGSASTGRRLRRVPLAQAKDDLSRFLRLSETEEILITRHGKPAGVLIGFASEEDWVDYRIEHHPEFLRRVAEARKVLAEGGGCSTWTFGGQRCKHAPGAALSVV